MPTSTKVAPRVSVERYPLDDCHTLEVDFYGDAAHRIGEALLR